MNPYTEEFLFDLFDDEDLPYEDDEDFDLYDELDARELERAWNE